MTMYNDEACRVPEGSFFNFATLQNSAFGHDAKQYYKDIDLECSSLFTEENIEKIDRAYELLELKLLRAEESDEPSRLDEIIRSFQETLGPELLEELRRGQDYVTEQYGRYRSELPAIFDRKMNLKLFAAQAVHGLGSLYNSNPAEFFPNRNYLFPRKDNRYGPLDWSYYASYLSNVAAWLCRPQIKVDVYTIHVLSLLLARGTGGNEKRDIERVYEATAVIAAELVRRPNFVPELSHSRMGTPAFSANFVFGRATWDRRIVSLRAAVDRLTSNTRDVQMADAVRLCIDNRLTVNDDEPVEREDVFEPKLIEPIRNLVVGKTIHASQSKTELLPKNALVLSLGRGIGVPLLVARNEMGHPAILVPADGKTAKFLAKVYGFETPTPLVPMDRESSVLWSCLFDPQEFSDLMRRSRRGMFIRGQREAGFVPGDDWVGKRVYVKTRELAEFIRGVDATGMHVNEYMLY